MLLRDTREALGLTLDEIEDTIHIRACHLQALEEGNLDSLPSPVQTRGFLRNYAEFLGLQGDEILLRYAELIQRKTRQPIPNDTVRDVAAVVPRPPRLSWLNSDLFITVVLSVFLVSALIWGGISMLRAAEDDEPDALPQELPAAALIPVSETPTAAVNDPLQGSIALVLLTPTETATLPLVLNTTSGVALTIIIERSTWLRVLEDGEEVTAGRFAAGEVLEFRGEESVEVAAGNAGGVRVFYQGEDEGILGDLNQAVIRIWTLDGMITPTPVITETPSPTPSATITPTPTYTRTPGPGQGGQNPGGN